MFDDIDLRGHSIVASGGIGHEWVYQKDGVRRTWVIPDNPQTEEQQTWRYKFRDVLCELMIAGDEWRQFLYDKLGPRWHARIIGRCLASEAVYFLARLQEFGEFDQDDQDEWASYDDLGELVNDHGAVFFCVACKVWDELHALGIDPGYSSPSAGNSAEVAAVWPREVGAMFLTKAQADLLYSVLNHLHDDRYLQSVPQQDHGGLAGLADDDHAQYLNSTRHTGIELIEDINLVDADQASFDFQSIPSTYKHLEIVLSGRTDRASPNTSDAVKLKCNNDGGNNYVGMIQWINAADVPGNYRQTTAGAPHQVCYLDAVGSTANWVANTTIRFFDYANGTFYKTYQARGFQPVSSGSTIYVYDAGGMWLSATVISRITLLPVNGSNFKRYSRATLYGLK
jgi:hypothetical protein